MVKLDREKYIFYCDSNKLACASYISLLKLRKQIEEQRAEGGKVIYALTFASQRKGKKQQEKGNRQICKLDEPL